MASFRIWIGGIWIPGLWIACCWSSQLKGHSLPLVQSLSRLDKKTRVTLKGQCLKMCKFKLSFASETKLYFYAKEAVFADNTKFEFHVKEALFTNSAKKELHVKGAHMPVGQNFIFMLKRHSLSIKSNPNFMLKRQSLPIVKKSLMLKGHTCQWFKISIFMLKCLCIEIFENFLLANMKDG